MHPLRVGTHLTSIQCGLFTASAGRAGTTPSLKLPLDGLALGRICTQLFFSWLFLVVWFALLLTALVYFIFDATFWPCKLSLVILCFYL